MRKRKILVTCALPYANGQIHLGHMVEHIQADIWVRYQRLRQHECYFVCADDAHGTPIMLKAKEKGIEPQVLIDEISQDHQRDFSAFNISFDHYHSTHSEENRVLSEEFYGAAVKGDHIEKRVIKQAYDETANMFLPDRFIKGICPRCDEPDQYGDNCEKCGSTYNTTELKNALSVVSGTKPIEKETEHLFFKVNDFKDFLQTYLASDAIQTEMANKMLEWFEDDLRPWDISRDEPYWGFKIPGTVDKYFYVWLDAPIGYLASFKFLCEHQKIDFASYWDEGSEAEIYHFIGKDIAYFHTLFWPAMLKSASMRLPTKINIHGFLTVDGQKMSKSRGTFIQASSYLKYLPAEPLRYFYAAKLNNTAEDIDLNLEDFIQRVNSDLVGKVVNIASRCAGFITKKFEGKLASHLPDNQLFDESVQSAEKIAALYENRQYSQAMRKIMLLADQANQYIDAEQPWVLAKDKNRLADVQLICTLGLNLFRNLIIYLKPVLPQLAKDSEAFFNQGEYYWKSLNAPELDVEINRFKPLMNRLEKSSIDQMLNENKMFFDKVK